MADHETHPSTRDAAYERWLRAEVPRFSRRALLGGAVVVAASSVLPAGCTGSSAAKVATGLGPDRAFFERLIAVVLPVPPGSAFVRPEELPVLHHLDTMLRRVDPELRSDLSTGIGLFNWSAVFLGFHFRPFLSLDDEDALAHCRRWEQGNITQRGLMNAMKSMIQLSYWREPATWPAVHYDGPVSARIGAKRLGVAPLPPEDQPPAPAPVVESAEVTPPTEETRHAR